MGSLVQARRRESEASDGESGGSAAKEEEDEPEDAIDRAADFMLAALDEIEGARPEKAEKLLRDAEVCLRIARLILSKPS